MPDSLHDDSPSDTFELSLDEMLERVSASTRAEQDVRGDADSASANRTPRPPIPPAQGIGSVASAEHRRGRVTHFVAWPLFALLAVGIGVIAAGRWNRMDQRNHLSYENLPPPAAGRPLASPIALPASAGHAPVTDVAFDADASTEKIMLDELDRAGDGARLSALTAEPGAEPTFAIARYDTLQAVPPDWRVVAPLNVEAVYALVPFTSRLRDLSDLRRRRIDVGAPGSARATSGEALYHALFAEPLPASPRRSVSRDAGLQALVTGGFDAMVFFDGQPSAWLEALPAETRRRLRVLRFDATGVADRKALRTYLPASVAPALANDGSAVPTLGEVAFLVASPHATRARQVLKGLCELLPMLQARGHPDWQQVDPTLQLPVKLQRISDLDTTLQTCRTSKPLNSPILSLSGARP